jgi:transcriptional regulator with XRE-family HTH domain
MEENLYERYAKIRDLKGLTDYKIANITGIGTPTISNWKNGKYQPKDDKIKKIADVLEVTTEYLKGDVDYIICPICGFLDNPVSELSRKEHEVFHQKILKIKEKYPFFVNYAEANKIRSDSISAFRNPENSIDEKVSAFDDCLKAEFSLEISRSNYEIRHLNYEDFCKREVGTLEPDWAISQELIDRLVDKYGVDKNFFNGNEQLLARASNNQQLMNLLRYAEKLNPDMLNSIEVQIKALAESNNDGQQ